MTSITNGWDAVCALDEAQVNALLQYPNTEFPLTFGIMTSELADLTPYGAVVHVTAPQISLLDLADGQTATAAAAIDSAVIVWAQGAMWFSPQCLSLQRSVQLQQIAGTVEDSIGAVALVFPGAPTQQYATTIYEGLTNGLANARVVFPIGELVNTNPGPGLMPTAFSLAVQSDSAGNSALLLLITTAGTAGSAQSLTTYPLSSGVTAALIISEDLLWSQVLPDAFETAFNQDATAIDLKPFEPITFASQQAADGSWSMAVTSGTANLGVLVVAYDGKEFYLSSCGNKEVFLPGYTFVPLPLTNDPAFLVTASGPQLQQSYATSFLQSFGEAWTAPDCSEPVQVSLSFSSSSQPVLDPTTGIVWFSGGGNCSLALDPNAPPWLLTAWNGGVLSQLYGAVKTSQPFKTETFFPYARAASINSFALDNLLFPGPTKLTLNSASLAGDLILTGSLDQVFSIQPQTVSLPPGGTQQFTASAATVEWKSSDGTIDKSTGFFTAPAANAAQTITITAFDTANDATTEAAVTIVIPGTGLVVSPTAAVVALGFPIFATDTLGNSMEVNCTCGSSVVTLTRQDVGYWSFAFNNYPSPGENFTVNVASVSNSSLTATIAVASISGQNDAFVTVTFDPSTGVASASAPGGNTEFYWAVAPASAGSVVPVPGNTAQANVTVITPQANYAVCAYFADLDAGTYGFGASWPNGGIT